MFQVNNNVNLHINESMTKNVRSPSQLYLSDEFMFTKVPNELKLKVVPENQPWKIGR